ncbi:MAG: hypothetical protein K2K54_09825 [Lachnospiraceae bacterium]|nr:hypothetical protein [Lachnospiraceae bacterium]
MKSKKWDEFQKLTEKCYACLAGIEQDRGCWQEAFAVLKEIITEVRSRRPEYFAELYQLDEETDYRYDVEGWLEGYLDEVDMQEEHEKTLEVCDELLGMFRWEEEKPSNIKFLKALALGNLGRNEGALQFCRQWMAEEPDNIMAVAANIYIDIKSHAYEDAEKLIKQHIQEETRCTEENDILFTAASAFYKASGNKEEQKRMERALQEYEDYLEKYLTGMDEDDLLFDDDDEGPFF